MNDFLTQLRMSAYGHLGTMSNLTWFTPTKVFWQRLAPHKHEIQFVDAGCGVGNLTRAALKRGYKMLPVDLVPRDGQIETVLQRDAVRMGYGPMCWPMICRPDHSGWVYDCVDAALYQRATAFYVSLPHNKDRDLDDYVEHIVEEIPDVGVEGETMYVLKRNAERGT